jgi:hypothetical protein
MDSRVVNVILVTSCVTVAGFLIWSSVVKARAARYLEKQIAAGKIKIEVASPITPSAN